MLQVRAGRRLVVALAAGSLVLGLTTSPVGAVEAEGDCATRQEKLDAATNGTTVTLTGICSGSFTFGDVEITLQGDPADGEDGFDGPGGSTGPLLTGTDIGDTTIQDLVFRNGNATGNGGGVSITGVSTPQLDDLEFTGNDAIGSGGGLYLVSSNPGEADTDLSGLAFSGNTADIRGGGAFIQISTGGGDDTLTMTDNQFVGNATPGSGGGAAVVLGAANRAELFLNTFEGNTVEETTEEAAGHYGGGLYVERNGGATSGYSLIQVDNLFSGNTVEPLHLDCEGPCGDGDTGGGGEWIENAPTYSAWDRFLDNAVDGGTGEVEGGGVGLETTTVPTILFDIENSVAAGNSMTGGEGSGGGIYVGFTCSPCNTDLSLANATVSGNEVGAPIVAPGVGGGTTGDTLTAANSIVAGNVGAGTDIAGFESTTLSFSDACTGAGFTGGPHAGDGNICADPALSDGYHQTAASPTIDAGSNALVPAELTTDLDGDARIQDGDEDGNAVVDMGADEFVPPAEETEDTEETEEEPTPGDGVTPPGSIGENDGYCLGAADGGVFAFGNCQFVGAAKAKGGVRAAAVGAPSGAQLAAPMVGLAMTPDDKGYWMAGADGGVFAFGSAPFKGSLGGITLQKPIVGIAATPTGQGYWLVDSGGAVYGFGDAKVPGSTSGIRLNKPIVAMAATPSGQGYWLVAADGGVFAYGDATFHGSTGNIRLNQPMIGIAAYPGATGYWLVAADGGVFAFGSAPFKGSFGSTRLNKPIVAIRGSSTGNGYWLVASDGGVFSFGSAPFRGSTATLQLNQPIVDMTG